MTKIKFILLAVVIFLIGTGFGHQYLNINSPAKNVSVEKNTPRAFLSEAYDKIKENYWDNITDPQLIEMFKNASSALGNPLPQKIDNKDDLVKQLQKDQAAKLVSQVLSGLSPVGRSGLFTTKQEEALKNTVSNINPEKDLYKDLGVAKGASEDAVANAYQKKEEQLKKDQTPQAKQQLKQIAYAKDVLSQKDTKQRYDNGGVEPTIFTKILRSNILYLQFKKFSPTSLDEFQKAFDSFKDNISLESLVFDLRGNIGGAIDQTSYFLGFFLGKNQYAFDFYHKGEYLPFKTPTDKLPSIKKYKQVVVLIDNQTQSSAEMMASSFKKYHMGLVLGTTTKGWGTVERVFPLDNQIDAKEKYSIFLVHSITIRDDNLPIEGRGVEPDVKLTDPNWEQQVFSYFRNPNLTGVIKEIISTRD